MSFRSEATIDLASAFDQLIDLAEPARQEALDAIARDDPDSARQLTRLLRADQECRTADLPIGPPGTEAESLSDFGPYRIVRPLGVGGMGSVYLAEQTEPVKRLVALKLVRNNRLGIDLKRRFAVEQQALAALSHPLIAQFYEAGALPDGTPYFAMEYVDGTTIEEHCSIRSLGVRARIRLFSQVCAAVQFAHGRGMVHRDLKPPNILVSEISGQPVVKIIDFGIARILDEEPMESGKRPHAIMGTPDYMAPEQLAADPGEGEGIVDTRTDVYALGVILYRLLTGRTPYELSRRGLGFDQIRSLLATRRPTLPSIALNGHPGIMDRLGRDRLRPGKVRRMYRDDLDWIVLKALHRDPDQRYASADALGDDLRRFLEAKVVKARPAGRWYRFRKLATRNMTATAVAVMAFVGAIAVACTATIQARRTQAEAVAVEQVLDVMSGVFSAADPNVAQGNELTARNIVDRAAGTLEGLEPDHPARGRLAAHLGWIYYNLADYGEAVRLLKVALDDYRDLYGEDSEQVLDLLGRVGHAYRSDSQLDLAEEYLQQALVGHRRAFGSDDERTLNAIGDLLVIHLHRHQPEQALPLLEEAYRRSRALLGDHHLTTIRFGANLALAHADGGDHAAGIALLEPLIPRFVAAVGKQHPNVLGLTYNLATWYSRLGQHARSRQVIDELLPRLRQVMGPNHPMTLSAREHQATIASELGHPDRAVALQEPLHALRHEVHGPDAFDTLRAGHNLAEFQLAAGVDSEQSVVLLQQAVDGFRRLLGDDNELTLIAVVNLAQAMDQAGRVDEAVHWLGWARLQGFDAADAEQVNWISDLWERTIPGNRR